MKNSLLYKIALTQIQGVGDINAKKLLAYCGSAEAVFKEKKQSLMKVPGVGEYFANCVRAFTDFERCEREIDFIESNGVTPLFFTDNAYPKRLKNCEDGPLLLYYKGNVDLNAKKILSIVGTRKATEYGKATTEAIVKHFKGTDVLIVSGLAYGIDIAAHRSALCNGLNTVGVVAHGLDKMYPATHKNVSEKMLNQGGLLCDFISGTNPDRENFPKRNRIIAGMADATLVVEAAITGGALITAEIANSYNRDVFAVPGRIDATYSEGCNRFIAANKAMLITSGADIEQIMSWEVEDKKTMVQKQLFVELSVEEEQIVNCIQQKGGTLPMDDITVSLNFPSSKVASLLLTLELKGMIKPLPGKRFMAC